MLEACFGLQNCYRTSKPRSADYHPNHARPSKILHARTCAMSNQPHQAGHSLDTAAASGSAAASSSSAADRTLLTSYVLEPPEWRAPLLANKSPALYPDFFPGATALYPQLATQSAGHVPGISRDSSAGASGSHFVPVGGVTVSKEDELNETVAKLGFVNKAVVQVCSSFLVPSDRQLIPRRSN